MYIFSFLFLADYQNASKIRCCLYKLASSIPWCHKYNLSHQNSLV